MAEVGPLKITWTIGALTGHIGDTLPLNPLALKWTVSPLEGFFGSSTGLIPPLSLRWSIGRAQGVMHTTPLAEAPNPLNYNGTTYEVILTGGHAGLPNITIPARTIDAEEGGTKIRTAIVEKVPPPPPGPPRPTMPRYTSMSGLVTSTDYGADPANIGKTGAIQGAAIDSVTYADLSGNFWVYSAVYFAGAPLILQHHMGETAQSFIMAIPFLGPRIWQLRAIPGIGFAIVTSGGFYFATEALAYVAHQPRNAGIENPSGGRLALLADGSLIVFITGNRVYKSTDLGLRWTDTSANLPFIGMSLRDIHVATATHWWLATTAGIWKTTNGGATWILSNGNLEAQLGIFRGDSGASTVHGLSSAPNSCVIGLRGKVARTSNGGATWAVFGATEGLGTKPARLRVHQAGSVFLAAYGEFYEASPVGYVWRSADNGASWQVAFPGARATHVNDFASAFGFTSDLVAMATPKSTSSGGPSPGGPSPPDPPPPPWVSVVTGYQDSFRRSSTVTVTADVDSATLTAIAARIVAVDGKKARLYVRQVKDYRTQKYYQGIASGAYLSLTMSKSSLTGLTSVTLTAQDRNVMQGYSRNKVARVIPEEGVVVGVEGEGATIAISMLIDETITPQTRISWQGTEYVLSGIKYAISSDSRLMSLNTKTRTFAVPTSPARDGVSREIPVFSPPRVTAKRSRLVGGSRGSGGRSSVG